MTRLPVGARRLALAVATAGALAAGCAEPPDARDSPADEHLRDQGPTDDDPDDDGLPDIDRPVTEPDWAPDEVELEVERILADGVPDPWTAHDEYLRVLSNGDGGCPGHDTYIDDSHLYGCTASSGWFYSGVSEYHEREGADGELVWVEVEALGDLLFRSPASEEMEVGGHAKWRRWRDAETFRLVRVTTEHSGSWRWEGHEGWLAETVSGLYTMDLRRADGEAVLDLHGAAQIWGGELFFEDLTLREGACAWGATGTLRVRDPSGGWFDLRFGDTCAACGELEFAGAALGQICPDLSAIPEHLSAELEALQ